MQYFKNIFILYGIIIILFLGVIGLSTYIVLNPKSCPERELISISEPEKIEEKEIIEDTPKHIFVDIKGYVNKPGVYEMVEGSLVNDLISLAGGLKKNGTTDNINLSKKLIDETTLTILSKYELNKKQNNLNTENKIYEESKTNYEINENSSSNNNQNKITNSKISINTATKEQLMTLSGVGEKTAEKIIEYREEKKFEKLEDIKNVSGIGDAVFEKIKDNITL